jgi:hypothetical protein
MAQNDFHFLILSTLRVVNAAVTFEGDSDSDKQGIRATTASVD